MDPDVHVTHAGGRRALARHPWIYRNDVERTPRGLANGAIARVLDNRGRVLGRAAWSETSRIALRFVRWDDGPVDAAHWAARLEAAIARRERAGATGPARRVVFGEADEWPGLIVDQYGEHLAVQALTPAADRLLAEWVPLLVERLGATSVVARNDPKVRALEGLPREVRMLHGPEPAPFRVRIGACEYAVDLLRGQKTGAFLDQQENYVAAARHAAGAERALDAFAGEGGFALHLAPVAGSVEAIEASSEASARGAENAAANGAGNVTWTVANAFDRLHALDAGGARFGAIVLDPPAFAKSRNAIAGALRGYREINLRALRMLEPGGTLVTCSCSYHVGREAFVEVVAAAAADAGRVVERLELRGQAADHPVLVNVPETEYLKCLVLRAR